MGKIAWTDSAELERRKAHAEAERDAAILAREKRAEIDAAVEQIVRAQDSTVDARLRSLEQAFEAKHGRRPNGSSTRARD